MLHDVKQLWVMQLGSRITQFGISRTGNWVGSNCNAGTMHQRASGFIPVNSSREGAVKLKKPANSGGLLRSSGSGRDLLKICIRWAIADKFAILGVAHIQLFSFGKRRQKALSGNIFKFFGHFPRNEISGPEAGGR